MFTLNTSERVLKAKYAITEYYTTVWLSHDLSWLDVYDIYCLSYVACARQSNVKTDFSLSLSFVSSRNRNNNNNGKYNFKTRLDGELFILVYYVFFFVNFRQTKKS